MTCFNAHAYERACYSLLTSAGDLLWSVYVDAWQETSSATLGIFAQTPAYFVVGGSVIIIANVGSPNTLRYTVLDAVDGSIIALNIDTGLVVSESRTRMRVFHNRDSVVVAERHVPSSAKSVFRRIEIHADGTNDVIQSPEYTLTGAQLGLAAFAIIPGDGNVFFLYNEPGGLTARMMTAADGDAWSSIEFTDRVERLSINSDPDGRYVWFMHRKLLGAPDDVWEWWRYDDDTNTVVEQAHDVTGPDTSDATVAFEFEMVESDRCWLYIAGLTSVAGPDLQYRKMETNAGDVILSLTAVDVFGADAVGFRSSFTSGVMRRIGCVDSDGSFWASEKYTGSQTRNTFCVVRTDGTSSTIDLFEEFGAHLAIPRVAVDGSVYVFGKYGYFDEYPDAVYNLSNGVEIGGSKTLSLLEDTGNAISELWAWAGSSGNAFAVSDSGAGLVLMVGQVPTDQVATNRARNTTYKQQVQRIV